MTTNIESQELRRRHSSVEGIEHPRASTSDDDECFFSVLHEQLGNACTLKNVQSEWRVLCHEFGKRLDPYLPFYYYTSSKNRFHQGDKPDFDKKSGNVTRLEKMKVARREHVGRAVIGRASMIVRGTTSIRQQYHAGPVNLPPLPQSGEVSRANY